MIARSLAECFERSGGEARIVETFGYSPRRVARENRTYLWCCKHIPRLYNAFWNYIRTHKAPTEKVPYYLGGKVVPYFQSQIEAFSPDIIIGTHYYASSVLSYMQKNAMLPPNVVTGTILSDYCVHPYWEHSVNVDYIFQPFDNTAQKLMEKDFSRDQIVTSGLPIREVFYADFDRMAHKRALGLHEGKVVTVVNGGNGLGNTLKLVQSLLKEGGDYQIVVVNGKNEKSRFKIEKYLKKKGVTNVLNLGYVSNMVDYLRATDLGVVRCGSSVLTEFISLGIPMVLREKMIINEDLNKQFLVESGCAVGMKRISDGGKCVKEVLENEEKYAQMQAAVLTLRRPYSAQKIAAFLIEQQAKRSVGESRANA